jgi:hypothetical protein
MRIQNNKYRYCTTCGRTHKSGEQIECCPICNSHVKDNELYDLKLHNLSAATNYLFACKTCTEQLYYTLKREKTKEIDTWIEQLKDGDL